MTIPEFIAKWRKVELKERSAAQEHFLDLCNVFGHPTPAAADPTGESFCFEKGAAKHGPSTSSGQAALGFADVWKRGFSGWEYKGKHKQLNELRETWLNPPDWTRTEVMEFPGTVGGPWNRYIDPATIRPQPSPINHSPSTISSQPLSIGTVRYPRLAARDADCAARLKERTLTKLYNERPSWLADCHARLDAAVAAAYGWPADLPDEVILERLLNLNRTAAG